MKQRMELGFVGVVSDSPNSAVSFRKKPREGKLIGNDELKRLWVLGYKQQQLTTISERDVKLVLIGSCLAEHQTIVKAFQNAIEQNNYSQIMTLPGNYNAIVQDRDNTYVFVDAAGIRSVFYAVYQSCIVYSSLALTLKELLNTEVDRPWLATSLCNMTTLNLVKNSSPFDRINRVPPGHFLKISPGKVVECKRYWYGPRKYVRCAKAVEQVYEKVTEAIRGRTRLHDGNIITSDLSGGKDSTTVTVKAAQELDKDGKKLHTITEKTLSATQSSDVECAEHVVGLYKNIEALSIEDDESLLPFSDLQKVPVTDAPSITCLNIAAIIHKCEIIKSLGSQLHLDGNGGDETFSGVYSYFADLWKQLKFVAFFKHISGRSRAAKLSSLALMKSATKLSSTSYRQSLLEQIEKLKARDFNLQPFDSQISPDQLMVWDFPPNVAPWYSQTCLNLVIEEMQKWAEVATPFANSPGEHQARAIIQSSGLSIRIYNQIHEIHGVNLESPFLDRLVIDAALSARPEDRYSPFVYKPLLSRAFKPDLPKKIYERNTKANYTTDVFRGFKKNRRALQEIFQNSLLADMGLIDPTELNNTMEHLSMGFASSMPLFSQTLATELWLRRLSESSENFWVSVN